MKANLIDIRQFYVKKTVIRDTTSACKPVLLIIELSHFIATKMASYVEMAIDAREEVPHVISECLKCIDKMDAAVTSVSMAIDSTLNDIKCHNQATSKQVASIRSAKSLVEMLCEKKVQMAVANYDLLDENVRMIDEEIKVLEKAMLGSGNAALKNFVTNRYQAAQYATEGAGYSSGAFYEEAMKVDPNEPVYCICRQIAYGDMIACDNEDCAIEWFHIKCTNLSKLPRNKWLCSDCARLKKLEKKAKDN